MRWIFCIENKSKIRYLILVLTSIENFQMAEERDDKVHSISSYISQKNVIRFGFPETVKLILNTL